MNNDIQNGLSEAIKQLAEVMTDKNSVYFQQARKGYLRGIDYYAASALTRCLANSFQKYKNQFGVYPNIVNPVGFNEKIIWFKYFAEVKSPESGNKLLTSSFIPEELKSITRCPEIVWHSNSATLPDNDQLEPGFYYLKANHGCAMFRRIQYPLSRDDKTALEELCGKWLKSPYGLMDGEWWYHTFPKEILIEKSVSGNMDSKAWCFYTFKNANPFISVAIKTQGHTDVVWLDEAGKPLATQKNNAIIEKFDLPENFFKMQQQALAIGKNHNFIRVDFLLGPNEEVFLGEITLTPGNGLTKRPMEIDKALGNLWQHK